MDLDDERHGTTAGYSQHRRDGEEACQPCKTAKTTRIAQIRDEEDIALEGGSWEMDLRRRVLVWVDGRWAS